MNRTFIKIKPVLEYLINTQETIYIVGGTLRDWLLNKESNDIDFIVINKVQDFVNQLSREFKIPRIVLDEERDIFRLIYKDLSLDFAKITAPNIIDDLKQRDLTINALALPLSLDILNSEDKFKHLLDPCQGREDLHNKKIRGIAKTNFESDPLRLLRAFRFSTQLDFQMTAETLTWIQELGPLVKQCAKERIQHEVESIFLTSSTHQCLKLMFDVQFLNCVFPVDNPDIWGQFFEEMTACESFQESDAFSTSFPQAKRYFDFSLYGKRKRWVTLKYLLIYLAFYTHQPLDWFCDEYLISRKEKAFMKHIIRAIDILKTDSLSAVEMLHLFQAVKEDFWGLYLVLAVQKFDPTHLSILKKAFLNIENRSAHPVFYLSGKEIQAHLDMKPGPKIGEYIQLLLEAQATGCVSSCESALDYLTQLSSNQVE